MFGPVGEYWPVEGSGKAGLAPAGGGPSARTGRTWTGRGYGGQVFAPPFAALAQRCAVGEAGRLAPVVGGGAREAGQARPVVDEPVETLDERVLRLVGMGVGVDGVQRAKLRSESEREVAALTQRRDNINGQLTDVREQLASLTGAAVAAAGIRAGQGPQGQHIAFPAPQNGSVEPAA